MIRRLPSALSAARLGAAPILGACILRDHRVAALACFVGVAATDLLDGRLARALHVASPRGARLDVSADLAVVLCGFGALTLLGTYPAWLLLVFVAMFTQFVVTSRRAGRPVYDPIGKYYGAVLFGVLGVTLVRPVRGLLAGMTVAIVVLTVASVASRWYQLLRTGRTDGDPGLPRRHLSGYS